MISVACFVLRIAHLRAFADTHTQADAEAEFMKEHQAAKERKRGKESAAAIAAQRRDAGQDDAEVQFE